MRIQAAQNQTFQRKQRFLNQNQMKSLKTILTKMNAETKSSQNNEFFSVKIVKELVSTNSKTGLLDRRMLFNKIPSDKQMQGKTVLKTDKTNITINNESGEITNIPLFKSWKNISKKIDETISFFFANYENPELVNKKHIELEGFTSFGLRKLLEIRKGNIHA